MCGPCGAHMWTMWRSCMGHVALMCGRSGALVVAPPKRQWSKLSAWITEIFGYPSNVGFKLHCIIQLQNFIYIITHLHYDCGLTHVLESISTWWFLYLINDYNYAVITVTPNDFIIAIVSVHSAAMWTMIRAIIVSRGALFITTPPDTTSPTCVSNNHILILAGAVPDGLDHCNDEY